MNRTQYNWRRLTSQQRQELSAWRKGRGFPKHSPPHWQGDESRHFLITAACYEHKPYIGMSPDRMEDFSASLLEVFGQRAENVHAWCVLPNHYHILAECTDISNCLKEVGRFHGRTSHRWNGEETIRGRKVFYRSTDRAMRSERHFWATINYIHNNPIHHRYVESWLDWPWSSARAYLDEVSRADAERIWKEYPIRDYGKGWDDEEF